MISPGDSKNYVFAVVLMKKKDCFSCSKFQEGGGKNKHCVCVMSHRFG